MDHSPEMIGHTYTIFKVFISSEIPARKEPGQGPLAFRDTDARRSSVCDLEVRIDRFADLSGDITVMGTGVSGYPVYG